MTEPEINELITKLFRTESGKLGSVLSRILGFENVGAVDDVIQDTMLSALRVWRFKGIPDNPPAWLYASAKRKAIDLIRHGKVRQHRDPILARLLASEWTLTSTVDELFMESEIEDSQLRMIFACCHPAIPYESQIALTLKTLCGLTVKEIALCFLTNEETITKRLYRAREKIREQGITLEVPSGHAIHKSLEAVFHTLYLLFNEGYKSSIDDNMIRHDLCEEAMRLTLILSRHTITAIPECQALLALFCFQASRHDARLDEHGSAVLLEEQDRTKWNRALINEGFHYLNLATSQAVVSEYHLEAAIAACHARATDFISTDWNLIAQLYDKILQLNDTPVVKLNRAVALSYVHSPQLAIDYLSTIRELENSFLFHAVNAQLYLRMENYLPAQAHLDVAEKLVTSHSEREWIAKQKISIRQ